MAWMTAGYESVVLSVAIVAATAFAACSNDTTAGPRAASGTDASGGRTSVRDSGSDLASPAADASADCAVEGGKDAGADALVPDDATIPTDAPSQREAGVSL